MRRSFAKERDQEPQRRGSGTTDQGQQGGAGQRVAVAVPELSDWVRAPKSLRLRPPSQRMRALHGTARVIPGRRRR